MSSSSSESTYHRLAVLALTFTLRTSALYQLPVSGHNTCMRLPLKSEPNSPMVTSRRSGSKAPCVTREKTTRLSVSVPRKKIEATGAGRSGGGGGIERVGEGSKDVAWGLELTAMVPEASRRALRDRYLPSRVCPPGNDESGRRPDQGPKIGGMSRLQLTASTVRDGTERTPRRCHGVPVPRGRRRQGRRQKGEKDRQESQAGARDAVSPASPSSAPTPARDRLVTSRHSPRHRPSLFPSPRTAHEPLVRPQRLRYSSG